MAPRPRPARSWETLPGAMLARRLAGRQSLDEVDSQAFRERLMQVMRARQYESRREYAARAALPPLTLAGWMAPSRPKREKTRKRAGQPKPSSTGRKDPDLPNLLRLARNLGLSLDWLLLGEGVSDRGVSREQNALEQDLRELILKRLGAGETRGEQLFQRQVLPQGAEILNQAITDSKRLIEASRQTRQSKATKFKLGALVSLAEAAKFGDQRRRAFNIDSLLSALLSVGSQLAPDSLLDPDELPAKRPEEFKSPILRQAAEAALAAEADEEEDKKVERKRNRPKRRRPRH